MHTYPPGYGWGVKQLAAPPACGHAAFPTELGQPLHPASRLQGLHVQELVFSLCPVLVPKELSHLLLAAPSHEQAEGEHLSGLGEVSQPRIMSADEYGTVHPDAPLQICLFCSTN